MDKIKIGIPRSLYYYYFKDLWQIFFEKLNIDIVISPKTNKEIIDKGISMSNDEMCMSLKIYIGHVSYLLDKCDYILIPRIDNYGLENQTCTNFLATYDIINNLFNKKIINYNIDLFQNETELKGFLKLNKILKRNKKQIKIAYEEALKESLNIKDKKMMKNINNLKNKKIKILLLGHPYNIYDEYIGDPIVNYLKNNNIEIIYSDLFDSKKCINKSNILTNSCYFKYNKENIGSILLSKKYIDGIIFLTTFPCGPDSLVNELVMRKINTPFINLIIDDSNILTGFETRLESFIDILERKKIHE
ncbi:MAG: acyl-CoA dehydratase activase-related protein [Bacilli bacterium]|nr:acyl-CoA dehydratase activase-related protein [Bacilli bacterium]